MIPSLISESGPSSGIGLGLSDREYPMTLDQVGPHLVEPVRDPGPIPLDRVLPRLFVEQVRRVEQTAGSLTEPPDCPQ